MKRIEEDTFLKGTTYHRILVELAAHGETDIKALGQRIAQSAGRLHFRNLLVDLEGSKFVRSINDRWSITDAGLIKLTELGEYRKAPIKSSKRDGEVRAAYRTPKTFIRPGAMDFMQWPSRMGETRIWYGTDNRIIRTQVPT